MTESAGGTGTAPARTALRETALVLPVPAAEPLVGSWRGLFDPSADLGIPAHITVLYPFVEAERLDEGVLGDLRELFRHEHAFRFTLASVRRFDSAVLYLAPKPADPFVRLTMTIWSRYPDRPPYGGRYRDVVPHLTVAETAHAAQMDSIEEQLRPGLPIEASADRVLLMEETAPGGRWQTRAEFRLPAR